MKKNILSLYSLPHFGAGELFKILKGNAIKVLLSICSANLENSEVDTGSEKASFHSKPKEEQCIMFKLQYSCAHSTRWQSYAQNPSS